MGEQSEQQKFAVLIDGDNAQVSLLPQILAEVSKVGLITIKRIYGDWTTANMNSGRIHFTNMRFNLFSSSGIQPARTQQIVR